MIKRDTAAAGDIVLSVVVPVFNGASVDELVCVGPKPGRAPGGRARRD